MQKHNRLRSTVAALAICATTLLGAVPSASALQSAPVPDASQLNNPDPPLFGADGSDIPVQPLRIFHTTNPTLGSSSVEGDGPILGPMNEPVWTKTCQRGFGMEIWNNIPAEVCGGTIYYHYYGNTKSSFNMLRYQAGAAVHIFSALNTWCSQNSLWCNTIFAIAGMSVQGIWGTASA